MDLPEDEDEGFRLSDEQVVQSYKLVDTGYQAVSRGAISQATDSQ